MTTEEWAVARKSLMQVAIRNGKTLEEVRDDIKEMSAQTMNSEDKAIRDQWRFIPCSGKVPTPEEFIIYASKRVLSKNDTQK